MDSRILQLQWIWKNIWVPGTTSPSIGDVVGVDETVKMTQRGKRWGGSRARLDQRLGSTALLAPLNLDYVDYTDLRGLI